MAMAGYIPATASTLEESEHHADQQQLSLSEEELDELYLEIVQLYKHISDEYKKALKRVAFIAHFISRSVSVCHSILLVA